MKMPSERQNVRSDGILGGARHRANAFKHSLTNAGPLYINPLYTWTAVVPKRIFSAASPPSIMPPTPIIGNAPSMCSASFSAPGCFFAHGKTAQTALLACERMAAEA